ncbi:MAG: helix-turn-helix domain-containing protein, partial [Nevskiales bacterium]
TRISFDRLSQPGMRLTLPLSVIHTKPMMANSESLKVAEEQCRVLLEKIFDTGNIGDWARMMLRESSDGLPSIEELAGALNISTRTLHRHLKNEGLVYRSLCVEERERRAKELLCSTRLSVTRIALELGYSDASNFTRRFKELTGHTPNAYREKYGT